MKILHQWKGLNGSMKSALNKDFIRDILKSKGRFLSIVAIVALGVAFFIGVKSSPIVMKTASDKYYDDNNLMDIRLLSSMGLTDDDVNEIKNIKGVDGVFSTYSLDVMGKCENVEIMRTAYAIEYDSIDPTQLKSTLEFKAISGLYGA